MMKTYITVLSTVLLAFASVAHATETQDAHPESTTTSVVCHDKSGGGR
jgi:hypothetical protein